MNRFFNRLKNGLSEHDLKSINILQETCNFDFENRLVDIPLHFNSVDNIIDASVSKGKLIKIATPFINELKNKIANVPSAFSINFILSFDTINGLSHEEIVDSIQEKMEEQYNKSSEAKKNACYKVIVYVIVCVIISLLKNFDVTFDYTAGVSSAYSNIIHIILDSIASLFLCQATYQIFDLAVARHRDDGALFKRINSFTLSVDDKEVLTRNRDTMFKYWPYRKMKEKIAYALMLFSSGYVMTICVVEIILSATSQIKLNTIDHYLFLFQWIFIIFMIIVNTSFYFGRGVLSKYAFNISSGYIILLTVYNTARMIIEHSHGIPFDSDNYLFTYQTLSIINTYSIYLIQKERDIRNKHLLKEIEKRKASYLL